MNVCRRKFTTSNFTRAIKPPFAAHNSSKKSVKTFEKNLPLTKPVLKPWEAKNINKDDFFGRKYANITPEYRKLLDEKVEKQRRLRKMKKEGEKEKTKSSEIEKELRIDSALVKDFGDRNFEFSRKRSPFFEYVYGTHAVKSALLNKRRSSYNTLYVHNGDPEVVNLAQEMYGIKVIQKRSKNDLNLLTNNGIHNGLVLETKPITIPEIFDLSPVTSEGEYEIVKYDDLDDSHVKLTSPIISKNAFPLGVFLDGISDPQNMGNIIRSCFYLGVDFVILPKNNSAKLGAVTAKASCGSLDMMNIYESDGGLKFIDRIKKNGWNLICTAAKPKELDLSEAKDRHVNQLEAKYIDLSILPKILQLAPILLVIGSEGTGLTTNMKLRSNYLVGIEKGREGDELVDSLNASVAAGIIINATLNGA